MSNLLNTMEEYSWLASWAIWESLNPTTNFSSSKDIKENIDFNDYQNDLQKNNIVIIAMNPGGESNISDLQNVTRKRKESINSWKNFHSRGRSNDHHLASAFNDSKARGAYMTDFFPIVGSDSSKITDVIDTLKSEEPEQIKRLVKELDDELSTLLPTYNEVNLICLGSVAEKWAKTFLSNPKTKYEDLNKTYNVYKVFHHSPLAESHRKKYAVKHNIENNYATIIKKQLEEQGLKI